MGVRSIIANDLGLGDLKRAVNAGLDDAVKEVEKDIEAHTSSWQTSVVIEFDSSEGNRKVIVPTKIFRWVDHGTKPHVIVPKRKKALSFKAGGRRKTTPGSIASGSGSSGSNRVTVKQVMHPGSKGSKFSDTIKKKYDRELGKIVQGKISEVV